MKKMNVEEMTSVNGGIAFATLCSWLLYSVSVSCAASVAKSYLNRGKKKKQKKMTEPPLPGRR